MRQNETLCGIELSIYNTILILKDPEKELRLLKTLCEKEKMLVPKHFSF